MARAYERASARAGHPFDDVPDLPCRRNPDAWFPQQGGHATEAKEGCASCPVEDACLTWALQTDQGTGVWGGYAADARRSLHPAVKARLIDAGRAQLVELTAARDRALRGRTTAA